MISLTRASSVAALLATFTALSGCNSDRDENRRRTRAAAQTTASLRVLHASPDAGNVDVSVDGTVAVPNAPYKAGTAYLPLSAGSHLVQVSPAGTTTPVITANPDLGAGKKYTAVAIGRVATPIDALLLEDDPSPVAATGARLRVVHAAPGAGTVDVYLTSPGADLSTTAPTLDDVPFKTASAQLPVPPGTYQVRITASNSTTPVYDSGPITIPGGADWCVAALETSQGASPVTLVALTGDPAAPTAELTDRRAFVRVVHASPDAPNVDVLVDGAVVLSNVPFRTASSYLEVPSGARLLQVNVANTTTTAITATETLDKTQAYTVLAVDRVSAIDRLVLLDDRSAPAAGMIKVRLVHAAPSAGLVDIYVTPPDASLASSSPTLAGVDFKAASGYLEVPAGTYRVRITPAGSKTAVIDTGAKVLPAGTVLTGIAVDPLPGTSAFDALLLSDR